MPDRKTDDPEVKAAVENMIKLQLAPLKAELDHLKNAHAEDRKWRLGFWSNGSGEPLGIFQKRVIIDDERYAELKTFIQGIATEKSASAAVEKYRTDRWQSWAWLRKVGIACLIAFLLWMGAEILSVTKIVWENYKNTNPGAAQKLKSVGNADTPAYATKQKPPEHADSEPNRPY